MDSKLEKILLLAGGTAVIGAAVWWVWNKYFDEDSDDELPTFDLLTPVYD